MPIVGQDKQSSSDFFQMPFGIQIIRCPKCRQPVYHAEEVLAAGKKWHKLCFKCGKYTMEY